MMTDSIVFNIGVFTVIGATLIGMVFVDFIMSYLQSDKDPWRIYITQGQALFQIVVLFSASYLAYAFGRFIGSILPYSRLLSEGYLPFLRVLLLDLIPCYIFIKLIKINDEMFILY
jgi:hypothetical protein